MVAAVIGFITALATFNMMRKCDTRPPRNLKQIGEITALQGAVERRVPGAVNMESVPSPRPIYHQDLLVTQRDSSLTLSLTPDGPTLRLNENTRFVAEFDATQPGAFIGTLLDGTLTVLNPGRKGLFRLFREGQEISLESAEKPLVPVIPAETLQPTEESPAATAGIVITATVPDDSAPTSTPARAATAPTPPTGGGESELLTNDDIIRALRNQTGLFQRCYLGFIHRRGSGSAMTGASGKITMRFTVQPSGRANEAQVVQSEFNDPTLHNCVREVIERARFKTFRGAAVVIQEFPITLQ